MAPLRHANTLGNKISSHDLSGLKGIGSSSKFLPSSNKKQVNTIDRDLLDFNRERDVDRMSNSNQYLILPEYNSEIVYQELLPKLMTFSQNIEGNISLWREHAQFFQHFAETVHHFHMPEIHDNIIDSLFTLIQSGNNHLRQAISKLLAAIMVNQHDPERRQTLSDQIVE